MRDVKPSCLEGASKSVSHEPRDYKCTAHGDCDKKYKELIDSFVLRGARKVVFRFFRRGNNDSHSDRARAICDELRANASDLIDGECDEELIRRLEAHLAECTDCDGWTESLRSTIELLRNVPKQTPPAEIMERIRAATTQSK